jgi:amidohydrolase
MARESARSHVEANRPELLALALSIHEEPELMFEERRSVAKVAAALRAAGMTVDIGIDDLPTALRATAGNGPMVIAICAEYDALPGIGHACGHNVIAAAAVGAGAALAPLADQLGITVEVLGTPAEEGGGGKILMLDRGAFAGVHAAMMVHPWPSDHLEATCLAVDHLRVAYNGHQAHASAAPEKGINAGDALVVAQISIGLLRQHMNPGDQVHGIVTRGGEAPNIVPGRAEAEFMLRAPSLEALATLSARVRGCFDAGALATGASLEISKLSPTYSEMRSHPGLLAAWRRNAELLGRTYESDDAGVPPPTLSTDMANVSLSVPSIHPLVGVDAGGASNHQPEFAAACVGRSAGKAVVDGALAMAWTAIDAATDPDLRAALVDRRGV